MQPFYEDYLNLLEKLHVQIGDSIAGLPQEALDWSPGPDTPSIGVLITHLSGANRYWIGDVAGEDPSNRDRDAEFRARGVPLDVLLERMHANLTYTRQMLETLNLADLSQARVSERDGVEYRIAWALLHALEHTSLHLGHIQIIRQLWDKHEIMN